MGIEEAKMESIIIFFHGGNFEGLSCILLQRLITRLSIVLSYYEFNDLYKKWRAR